MQALPDKVNIIFREIHISLLLEFSFDIWEIKDQFQYSGNQYPAPNYFSNSGHFTRTTVGGTISKTFTDLTIQRHVFLQKECKSKPNYLCFNLLSIHKKRQVTQIKSQENTITEDFSQVQSLTCSYEICAFSVPLFL